DEVAEALALPIALGVLGLAGRLLLGSLGAAEVRGDAGFALLRGHQPSASADACSSASARAASRRRFAPSSHSSQRAASASPRSQRASECSSVGAPCSSSDTTRTSSSRACSNERVETSGAWSGIVSILLFVVGARRRRRAPRRRAQRAAVEQHREIGSFGGGFGRAEDRAAGPLRDRVAALQRRGGGEGAERSAQLARAALGAVDDALGDVAPARDGEEDLLLALADHRLGVAQRRARAHLLELLDAVLPLLLQAYRAPRAQLLD